MKKILVIVFICFLFVGYSFAGDWYKGGTLHKSTLSEWCKASYQNRLATCSDWIVTLVDKKQHGILFKDNMKVLKGLSVQLEKCVTDGNIENGKILIPSMKSSESAVACWILMQKN